MCLFPSEFHFERLHSSKAYVSLISYPRIIWKKIKKKSRIEIVESKNIEGRRKDFFWKLFINAVQYILNSVGSF